MEIKHQITLCLGSSCFARGSKNLRDFLITYIKNNQLTDKVSFKGTHCTNNCADGPCLIIDGILLKNLDENSLEIQLNKLIFNK